VLVDLAIVKTTTMTGTDLDPTFATSITEELSTFDANLATVLVELLSVETSERTTSAHLDPVVAVGTVVFHATNAEFGARFVDFVSKATTTMTGTDFDPTFATSITEELSTFDANLATVFVELLSVETSERTTSTHLDPVVAVGTVDFYATNAEFGARFVDFSGVLATFDTRADFSPDIAVGAEEFDVFDTELCARFVDFVAVTTTTTSTATKPSVVVGTLVRHIVGTASLSGFVILVLVLAAGSAKQGCRTTAGAFDLCEITGFDLLDLDGFGGGVEGEQQSRRAKEQSRDRTNRANHGVSPLWESKAIAPVLSKRTKKMHIILHQYKGCAIGDRNCRKPGDGGLLWEESVD
jgi:hypothetical protein